MSQSKNAKTICLNMIVKNEAHCITETLESIYKYINYYVINDTGSTDSTIKTIIDFFNKKQIKGEIIEHEFRTCKCHTGIYKKYSWFHFGWNRTFAMEQCKGKGDYVWVIDADDIIVGNLILPELKADSYLLKIGTDFTYQRQQIFKNTSKHKWKYMCGRHEYPKCIKKGATMELIEGDYYLDSRRQGDRNKNPNKLLDDAKALEDELEDSPGNERLMFYIAQSYFDHGDYKTGNDWYKKRVDQGGWYEEVYYSKYRIADGLRALHEPWKVVEKAYLEAFNYCKNRAEPLYKIAEYYQSIRDYPEAIKYYRQAEQLPFPKECKLFIQKDVYDYRISLELSKILHDAGNYYEAFSITKKLLSKTDLQPNDRLKINHFHQIFHQKAVTSNKMLCCIYFSNDVINQSSKITQIVTELSKYYKVVLIGNKIDANDFQNVVILDIETFKINHTIMPIQFMILYNNLNYFYDNMPSIQNTVLIQEHSYFRITGSDGINIGIYSSEYLDKFFVAIKKIVCINDETKTNIETKYNIKNSIIGIKNSDDYYKIIDDQQFQYSFQCDDFGDINGIKYMESNHVEFLRANIYTHKFEFVKKLLIDIHSKMINPEMIETEYMAALCMFELDYYDDALAKIEKIVQYQSITDMALLLKAKIMTKRKKYLLSFNIANDVLKHNNIPELKRWAADEIRDYNIEYIRELYINYPKNKIDAFKFSNNGPKVLITMTTCKRLELFEKTVNSFLNCCLDINLIWGWICVDDNSSDRDREKMQKLYPFIEFIWKGETEKGHYISMNIIYKKAQVYDYILHLEDDWHFIERREYVSDSIKIFSTDEKIGQVLFNRNYYEIEPYKKRIPGGFIRIIDNLRYVIHEHYKSGTPEYNQFTNKYKGYGTNAYWPHFSFRPSMLRVSMLQDVGYFYNTPHFEMAYANEYVGKGYISVFLDTFCAIHIGKKTWERSGTNSYVLNQINQFGYDNKLFTIKIISNDIVAWSELKGNSLDKLPSFTRHIPRRVNELDGYEKRLFLNNDFNYVRSIISKIMAHIDCYKNLGSKYLILLSENIKIKSIDSLLSKLKNGDYKFGLLRRSNDTNIDGFNILEERGYVISNAYLIDILKKIEIGGIRNEIDFTKYFDSPSKIFYDVIDYDANEETSIIDVKNFKEFAGYKFYSQMDSFGNDLGYMKKSIDELKQICDGNSKAVGFNTLGWIKTKINAENEFIFLPNSTKPCDGLYVKDTI